MKFPRIPLWNRKTDAGSSTRSKVARFLRSYHAVEVQTGEAACLAIKTLAGKRILSQEAPLGMPLQSCTQMDSCECRFKHHVDRRIAQRRIVWGTPEARKQGKSAVSLLDLPPQRRSRGRREND